MERPARQFCRPISCTSRLGTNGRPRPPDREPPARLSIPAVRLSQSKAVQWKLPPIASVDGHQVEPVPNVGSATQPRDSDHIAQHFASHMEKFCFQWWAGKPFVARSSIEILPPQQVPFHLPAWPQAHWETEGSRRLLRHSASTGHSRRHPAGWGRMARSCVDGGPGTSRVDG